MIPKNIILKVLRTVQIKNLEVSRKLKAFTAFEFDCTLTTPKVTKQLLVEKREEMDGCQCCQVAHFLRAFVAILEKKWDTNNIGNLSN